MLAEDGFRAAVGGAALAGLARRGGVVGEGAVGDLEDHIGLGQGDGAAEAAAADASAGVGAADGIVVGKRAGSDGDGARAAGGAR